MSDDVRTASLPAHSSRLQAWLLELAARVPSRLPKLKARLVKLSVAAAGAEEHALRWNATPVITPASTSGNASADIIPETATPPAIDQAVSAIDGQAEREMTALLEHPRAAVPRRREIP